MPSFDDLCRRGCMGDVIQLVGQVPDGLAARSSVDLDDGSVETALLWMMLAGERRFWTVCLEELGVDVQQLTRELDDLLGEKHATPSPISRRAGGRRPWSRESRRQLDQSLDALLDRAAHEASAFGHHYLGQEHLLLAILSQAEGPLAELRSRHGIHYQDMKKALTDVLSQVVPAEVVVEPRLAVPPRAPWGAATSSQATGVPRRFSMMALFAITTFYAAIFAVMQSLGANPVFFTVIAVLITGIGVGQTLLFGGKSPRAASVCTGALLFPVEILLVIVYYHLSSPRASFYSQADVVGTLIFCIPAGAGLGYLAGGLAGGVFLLLDLIPKALRRADDEPN